METLAIEGGRPVRDTMLPYGRQWIDEADIEAVVATLRSDYVTQGPAIDAFERAVADYTGVAYAVAFTNGTAALHAACYAAGIGPGDEVITTPMTFLASSNCVLYQGGNPVFADIDPYTYNIDPDRIEENITERTKAIIAVDYTGQPAEMDRIRGIAERHGLIVIEDAAHSLGAAYAGRRVGSLADMTMFSFHPVKHVTTGEGGVIVTDDKGVADKLRLFRNHGMTRDAGAMTRNEGPWYYEMHELGYNYRMTDMQAALGVSQMKRIDAFVSRRREIAAVYSEAFREMPGLIPPKQHPNAVSSWHLYMLRWKSESFKKNRKAIFEALRAENIGVHVHYIPVYLQPYYASLGYKPGICPAAEQFYAEAITLPLFPRMTDQDVSDVVHAVRKVHAFFANSL